MAKKPGTKKMTLSVIVDQSLIADVTNKYALENPNELTTKLTKAVRHALNLYAYGDKQKG